MREPGTDVSSELTFDSHEGLSREMSVLGSVFLFRQRATIKLFLSEVQTYHVDNRISNQRRLFSTRFLGQPRQN